MSLTIIELVLLALEEIDDELQDEDVEIFHRPFHALIKVVRRFPQLDGMSLLPVKNPQTELEAVPGKIQAWYTARYGERLNYDPSMGSYPILIRREPWRARFPLCYGRINLVWDPDLDTSCQKNEINIPTKIDGLSRSLVSSLNANEVSDIFKEYIWAMNVLTSLSSNDMNGMIEAAFADYNAGIENLFARNPHNGQCKWSALQFAEKSMKQRLANLGVKAKQIHDLKKLSGDLLPYGVNIDPKLISEVQCQASVRYGEVKVTRLEAVNALQSALKIYSSLFPPNAFEFSRTR